MRGDGALDKVCVTPKYSNGIREEDEIHVATVALPRGKKKKFIASRFVIVFVIKSNDEEVSCT